MPRQATKVERVCLHCGNVFLVLESALRHRTPTFCSQTCYGANKTMSLQDRFAQFVGAPTETGCILWTGPLSNGYGLLQCKNRKPRQVWAHRLAYEMANGPIPDGLCVLHNCPGGDNTRCVNAAHLFLGTRTDNAADRDAKGRTTKGTDNPRTKLDPDKVRKIREQRALHGTTYKILASENDISISTVESIILRHSWKYL